jgi:SagB-type dehydrogenase family enzyme
MTLTLVDTRGVWRYQPDGHALVLVRVGDRRRQLAAAALGEEAVAEAPAAIVVTANPAVLGPRYRERAERYCILEGGHVAQNVLLEATALGLASVPIGAFEDSAVLAAVDLGPEHLALYILPVGAPRSDGT